MAAYYNEVDPYAAAWLRNLIAAGHIAAGEVDERDIRDVRPVDLLGFDQCHFFAGLGGWSYALRLAGWSDDKPVWTGSCPCQPFSAAGKGAGFTDERHLWPDFFHLIQHGKHGAVPVFGEQVASKDGLAWLDLVHADMEGAGYAFAATDICAAGVGAPHIRQRLYFVADSMPAGWTEGRARTGSGSPASSSLGGMGNNNNTRLEGLGRGHRAASGRVGTLRPVAETGELGGMADTDGRNASAEGIQRSGQHGQQPQDGDVGGVELADSIGRNGREAPAPGHDDDLAASERAQGEHGLGVASAPRIHQYGAGPTNGHWRDADWLCCRDGKWRPVEPGTFPLAHGLSAGMGCVRPGEDSPFRVIKGPNGKSIGQAPWRIGMLRAYGNAIVPQVAAEFVKAYLECRP